MTTKDLITLLFSFVALVVSLITFYQVQQDRKSRSVEAQPRILFSYSPYGVDERYGFSIKNIGSKMARIPFIKYTYNELPKDAVIAGELLEALKLSDEGDFHLRPGPNFMLEPNSEKEMYTFSEKLDQGRQNVWAEYSKYIAADVCYCDIEFRQCWTKRVSLRPDPQVASDFKCDADDYRSEMKNGRL